MSLEKTVLYCLVLLVPTKAMNESVAVSQNVILHPTQASSFRSSISEQTESLTYQHLVSTRAASRQPSTTGITHMPADREELRLFKDLFNGYDKRLRPVLRKEDNVTVKLGISLNQLIDLDERNQLMKLSLFVRQIWYNPFLRWNKSHYGGISEINVNPSEVWKPDLILYNNADDSTDGSLDRLKTQIKIGSDGMNLWLSPIILRSSCKITVKYFPFDEQHCKLKFGSWTYDGFHLDLIPEAQAGDISKFVRNGEWKLVGAPCKRNEVKYVCCPAPYPDVTYDVQIRRRILFFLFNLVIPCLVIVALTILSFYLPPDSGERISLVITNLLAMTVFMLLVAEIIPPTSDEVSIISTFYSCCIFEVGLALIGTCVVLKYHFSNPSIHKMPGWVRFAVIHCLGRIFKRNNHETKPDKSFEKSGQLQQRSCVRTDNGYIETFVPRNEQLYKRYSAMEKRLSGVTAAKWPVDVKSRNIADSAERDPRGAFTERRSSEERDDGDSLTKALTQKQGAIADALEKLVEAQDAQDDEGKQREEWMMAASILDNMFMWIFLVTLVASVMVLVFQIPKYDD